MNKVIIVGAAGRMGRRLVANVLENPDFALAGAVERPDCSLLGADAGELAGCGKAGVAVTADIAALLPGADAVIVFSTSGALEIARAAVKANVACVIGTTALTDAERAELAELGKKGRLVCSTNMSVGVNLLFKLAAEAAEKLGAGYDIEIVEMHHRHKKDAPSGTAVTLGETVAAARGLDFKKVVRYGREGITGERTDDEIGMHSLRGGDVVGDHSVIFSCDGERVELTHKASSRDTFVKGALRAAAFLKGAENGLYTMRDVLNLN